MNFFSVRLRMLHSNLAYSIEYGEPDLIFPMFVKLGNIRIFDVEANYQQVSDVRV
jgi:hypothetical protein